jgi:hypothetical protein
LPSLPDGKYILFDPTTENMLCKSREKPYFTNAELACGVLCRIPEEDVRFYLLKSYAPKAEVQKAAYESDIRKEYDIIKKDNEKETENISSDGISISWADIDKDNVPELVIENKIQKVWINFSGGRIMKWLRKDRNLVKWNKNNGGLCMDIFQSSAWNGDEKAEYELISKMINDGRAVVVLQKKLKNSVLSGIVITKEFTVSGDKAEILVKYNINNESDSSKKISLRIHNKFNLPGGQDFIVPCEDGVKAFSGNANGKTDLYCCGRDVSPKMKSRSQGIFAGDWIVCASPKIKDGVCARIDGDRVSSVYSFQGRQPTCEWFYKLFTLEKNTNWQTEFSFKYLSDLQGSIIDATLNANK